MTATTATMAITNGRFVLPQQIVVQGSGLPAVVDEKFEALHQRVTAKLPGRFSEFGKKLKPYAMAGAGLGAATGLVLAAAARTHGMPGGWALLNGLVAGLSMTAMSLVAGSAAVALQAVMQRPGTDARTAATADAVNALVQELQVTQASASWGNQVREIVANREPHPHVRVVLEANPPGIEGFEGLDALRNAMLQDLSPEAQKVAALVHFDMDGSVEAKSLNDRLSGEVTHTLSRLTAPLGTAPLGAVFIGGPAAGLTIGMGLGVLTALAVGEFRLGVGIGWCLGALAGAVVVPLVTDEDLVTGREKATREHRNRAAVLLAGAIQNRVAQLPSPWRNAIEIAVGRDHRDQATLVVTRHEQPNNATKAEQKALRKAIAEALPPELAKLLAKVPLSIAAVTPEPPSALEKLAAGYRALRHDVWEAMPRREQPRA